MTRTIHESREDYLEAILELEKTDGLGVKAIDLANYLNVSMPAITKAMNLLKTEGYITRVAYGAIYLTPYGRAQALKIAHLHQLIFAFLLKLGVPEDIAKKDCCKIEHILSPQTIEVIEKFVKEHEND